ncbi:MAG: 5-formyltetrahydrofolate cyclo-ligase [Acidimicrobiales bacterium]
MAPERSKAEWRQAARDHRKMAGTLQTTRDRTIVAALESFLEQELERGDVVVLFDPLPGEVHITPIKQSRRLQCKGIEFALTRTPAEGYDLALHRADSALENHRFGYRQPTASSPIVADHDVAAVLVPALAFDRAGNRLGFGAGYYDRLLARLPTVLKIGIADHVVDGRLPTEPFDVPMTHLATAKGIVAIG